MLPLTEKYRPKDFDDFVGQDNVVEIIKQILENNRLMNMIFYGPPGTGKNTMARIIGDKVGFLFQEFDCSDNILNIYNIEEIVRMRSLISDNRIIFIDNAEDLNQKFQRRLTVVMEKYPHDKFILSCNCMNNLIDPLKSRCLIMDFKPFTTKQIYRRLQCIAKKEGSNINEDVLMTIARTSNSDMRKAVNMLESVLK